MTGPYRQSAGESDGAMLDRLRSEPSTATPEDVRALLDMIEWEQAATRSAQAKAESEVQKRKDLHRQFAKPADFFHDTVRLYMSISGHDGEWATCREIQRVELEAMRGQDMRIRATVDRCEAQLITLVGGWLEQRGGRI